MLIMSNGTKMIKVGLSDIIIENTKNEFTVELPKVICDNKKDAVYIQQRVNSLVNELSEELLKQ